MDSTDYMLLKDIKELLGTLIHKQDKTNSLLQQQLEVQKKIYELELDASEFIKNQQK